MIDRFIYVLNIRHISCIYKFFFLTIYISHFCNKIYEKRKKLKEGRVNFVSELDVTVNHFREFINIGVYI